MERLRQLVAIDGNAFAVFPRFSRRRDLLPVATGCVTDVHSPNPAGGTEDAHLEPGIALCRRVHRLEGTAPPSSHVAAARAVGPLGTPPSGTPPGRARGRTGVIPDRHRASVPRP